MIRRAVNTEDEAESLTRIHIDAWKWAYRGILPDHYLQGLDQEYERRLHVWRRVLGADVARSAVWVADEGDEAVGFASTGPSRAEGAPPTEAELYSIYLLERVAGTGVGNALFTAANDEMRKQGYLIATLWVAEANLRARRFYAREGWTPDGGRMVEHMAGFDLVEVRYRVSL
ncbi:MAG TPA: GNAT family N-acetyltransferase [Candidatus Dormibacteraeota bacterium]|nr:GNAT family N-acetyltransferase [Candidatus Dormibacteraeota bacterium]